VPVAIPTPSEVDKLAADLLADGTVVGSLETVDNADGEKEIIASSFVLVSVTEDTLAGVNAVTLGLANVLSWWLRTNA
jgi:hypothetical protein